MWLVIAEKPLLGKAIADAIPVPAEHDTENAVITKVWQGKTIKIAWCVGHLLELRPPEDYDEKYAKWRKEDLPIYFPNWEKRVAVEKDGKSGKAAIAKNIQKLLKEAECVVHAGDIDDEGQLIVDELLDFYHYKGRVLRLCTNDITPEALRKAWDNMTDNEPHRPAGEAANARKICDAVFGFNLTRYFTLTSGGRVMVTVGRVQTPTLGLVVRRDKQIAEHQKQFYYTLYAKVSVCGETVTARFVPSKDNPNLEDGRVLSKDYIQQVKTLVSSGPASPIVVTHDSAKESPPLPFNSTKLNSYCGNRWDMAPDRVLKTTQALRDKYKCITYNRSQCRYLPTGDHKLAPDTIAKAANNLQIDAKAFDPSIVSRAFDDKKTSQSDASHFAIVPTAIDVDMDKFTPDEKLIYTAICKYYLCQFLPPAEKAVSKLDIELPGHGKLSASSSKYTALGYREFMKDEISSDWEKNEETNEEADADVDKTNSRLSSIKAGNYAGEFAGCDVKEKETKPPAHYTAASLEEDMTRIAKYCTNKKVKELLLKKDEGSSSENGSIGTPATRPGIISNLIKHGLLKEEKKGKHTYVLASDLGKEFYNILPENIRGVDVTAKWWCFTEDIKTQKYTTEEMVQNVLLTVNAVINSGQGKIENIQSLSSGVTGECLGKCPKCGGEVFETNKTYKCMSEGCNFAIWKDHAFFKAIGKKLSPRVVTMLLEKKKVGLRGCTSAKTGKKFDAVIEVDFSGDKEKFSFAQTDALEPIGTCPKCGSLVHERGPVFSCDSPDCKFCMFKKNKLFEMWGVSLDAKKAAHALQKGVVVFENCKIKGSKRKVTNILDVDYSGDYARFEIRKYGDAPSVSKPEPSFADV